MRRTPLLLALLIGITTGCLGPTATVERSSAGIVASNGQSLNGQRLNGQRLNGRYLNGRLRNGRLRNGRLRNGTALDGIRAEDGFLVGDDGQGQEIVLADGDSFAAVLDDDREVTILVGAPVATAQAVAYPLSFTTPDDPNPQPVCEDGGLAIPLADAWNLEHGGRLGITDAITFACAGFALAKCVDLGYAPWVSPEAAAFHQTCTRMIRADYCGNGHTYTLDGTPINVYDREGIQADTESWEFEASWNEAGAACAGQFRHVELWDSNCEPIWSESDTTCRDTWWTGYSEVVLMKSEFQVPGNRTSP